ncbi:MAG: DUF4931 domain-containing protein [bacterium]|nr:DUF4931 domain-containing protein [bacterium]
MSELRHDPMQKRWIIIASERMARPHDFVPDKEKIDEKDWQFCPFCPGNEERTPPEIFAVRPPDLPANGPGWNVRVVPNKFPALQIEGNLSREGVGLYDKLSGVGAHEVIIESTSHSEHMADMSVERVAQLAEIWSNRISDLRRDARLRYAMLFRNFGRSAGATLSHPHSQIIATPVTPRTVSMELDAAKEHYERKERCLYCDILTQETREGERVIADNGEFVAHSPYASRFPFEIAIVPRRHSHDFTEMTTSERFSFARMLIDVLKRLRVALNDPPYNFLLHTAPNTIAQEHRRQYWNTLRMDWHWHVEILPRLNAAAGFEWGSGIHINPLPPEMAADYLRKANIS